MKKRIIMNWEKIMFFAAVVALYSTFAVVIPVATAVIKDESLVISTWWHVHTGIMFISGTTCIVAALLDKSGIIMKTWVSYELENIIKERHEHAINKNKQ